MIRKLLALLLLMTPGIAHAEWYEASTPHFVVYSDDKPERLKKFAANLEQFDKALRLYLKMPDPAVGPANRVTVYVVDDVADVARLAGSGSVAGFYNARAGGSLAFVPRNAGNEEGELRAIEILLHEYAHHFMYSMGSDAAYPRWFSEGFAEFAATARFPDDGAVTMGHPPQYRSYEVLDATALTIEEMFTADTLRLSSAETGALYGKGWLLTHYLMIGSGRRQQLGEYLRAVNSGKKGLEAAAVFGDLKALHAELQKYRKGKFDAFRVAPEMVKVGDPVLRKLNAAEVATMSVRMVSKRGVDSKTAPGVYERAKRAAGPFPKDPAAQIILAEAAYDAKDYAAAEAAADRAIAVDAKAVDALVYKAMARMEIAKAAKDTSRETWLAIRKIIASAIEIDLTDPEPLTLLYRSYPENNQPPTRTAKDALYLAHSIAPYDSGLRLNTAHLYRAEGDKAKARQLLQVLAYAPHGQGLAIEATRLIEEIDKEAAKTDKTETKPAEKTTASN